MKPYFKIITRTHNGQTNKHLFDNYKEANDRFEKLSQNIHFWKVTFHYDGDIQQMSEDCKIYVRVWEK